MEDTLFCTCQGESVPVDGTVMYGRSAVDESLLTGEAVLVPKHNGSAVTAGTINYEGPITIKALNTGKSSTLGGIARLVMEAQAKEAPVQRLADRVAGRFSYGIMGAAALTFVFWQFLGETQELELSFRLFWCPHIFKPLNCKPEYRTITQSFSSTYFACFDKFRS